MASKKRFMEAVAEKVGGKRRPMLKRKGGPTVVIAIGAPKMAPKPEPEVEAEDEGGKPLVCPKCGAELADTPENREYAGQREAEMEDEDESEDEESED